MRGAPVFLIFHLIVAGVLGGAAGLSAQPSPVRVVFDVNPATGARLVARERGADQTRIGPKRLSIMRAIERDYGKDPSEGWLLELESADGVFQRLNSAGRIVRAQFSPDGRFAAVGVILRHEDDPVPKRGAFLESAFFSAEERGIAIYAFGASEPLLIIGPSCFGFAWSPDSRRLVYAKEWEKGGVRGHHICVLDIGSEREFAVTRGYRSDLAPRFLPDGERVLFFPHWRGRAFEPVVGSLEIVEWKTGTTQVIPRSGPADVIPWPDAPGGVLAWTREDDIIWDNDVPHRPDRHGRWTMNLQSGGAIRIQPTVGGPLPEGAIRLPRLGREERIARNTEFVSIAELAEIEKAFGFVGHLRRPGMVGQFAWIGVGDLKQMRAAFGLDKREPPFPPDEYDALLRLWGHVRDFRVQQTQLTAEVGRGFVQRDGRWGSAFNNRWYFLPHACRRLGLEAEAERIQALVDAFPDD